MTTDYQAIIDKYYPASGSDPLMREIYMKHACQVADMAVALNESAALGLDPGMVRGAAMLHDIGICRTKAPGIHCFGDEPYIRHGIIGAEILRAEGAPEEWARVAENHTGTGLTADDIAQQQLPLPERDFMPETLMEKLVCYADKFYSKSGSMEKRTVAKARAALARHGGDSLTRFDAMHRLFGYI
ncbi:HDIG domain-containing metalloprotein [uncultured Muribaculum sp.]|uniref:HDIG domain-containing metalloprotein n=1 Tax=uncultured Muribaculum sp. TaxID=1918613 RepID=UPI0025FC729C|nr:HDIG domain-containing metalloprotein [uncultured Muribaculum sp.]